MADPTIQGDALIDLRNDLLAASDKLLDDRNAAAAAGQPDKVKVAEEEFDRIGAILARIQSALSESRALEMNVVAEALEQSIAAQKAVGLSSALKGLQGLVKQVRQGALSSGGVSADVAGAADTDTRVVTGMDTIEGNALIGLRNGLNDSSDRLLVDRNAAAAAGQPDKVRVAQEEIERIAVILETIRRALKENRALLMNLVAQRLEQSIAAQEAVGLSSALNGLQSLVKQMRQGELSGGGVSADVAGAAETEAKVVTGIDTILSLSTAPFRRPNGPVIMALQMALIKAGQAMEPDGDFGKITCDALRRWQRGQGFPESNSIDAKQWRALTGLPAPSLFDVCLNIVSDFEGTRFDRVVGNFDGAGITFGLIGFTLVNGEIQRLLAAIETLRPGIVANAFGALHPQLQAVLSASKKDQLSFADNISLGANKVEVAKPWKDAFQRIGQFPESRRAQIERAFSVYWKLAQQHIADFMSGKPLVDQDAGLWYDTSVQNSLDNEERQALKAATSSGTGEALRVAFANAIADGSSARFRKDVLSRKMTYAVGRGTVHGSEYLLSDWGLTGLPVTPAQLSSPSSIIQILGSGSSAAHEVTVEPDDEASEANGMTGPGIVPDAAIAPGAVSPHASWPLHKKFLDFVATLGLRNFVADELLFLGNQHKAGSCKGLNDYPPESLWRNIAPTVAVLDKLREELNAPIHFLSLYRAPAYNKCIDGSATNSFHMRYQAIDFVCDVGSPSLWAAKLRDYRARGVFSGGIGVYKSFVHCDTRGVNRDWTG